MVVHMRRHGLADDDCRFIAFDPALSVTFRRDGLILTVRRDGVASRIMGQGA